MATSGVWLDVRCSTDSSYSQPKVLFLGQTIYVVNDVNLQVDQGEFVVMGPSGSGRAPFCPLGGLIVLNRGADTGRGGIPSSPNGLPRYGGTKSGLCSNFQPDTAPYRSGVCDASYAFRTLSSGDGRPRKFAVNRVWQAGAGGFQAGSSSVALHALRMNLTLCLRTSRLNLDSKTSRRSGDLPQPQQRRARLSSSSLTTRLSASGRIGNTRADGRIAEITGGGMEGASPHRGTLDDSKDTGGFYGQRSCTLTSGIRSPRRGCSAGLPPP